LDQVVGVLPVSKNVRAHALQPQLTPVLKRVEADERPFLLIISKPSYNKFVVTTKDLPSGADDGAAVIAKFQDSLTSGLDLATAFDRLTNETLAAIPEVNKFMVARGITL